MKQTITTKVTKIFKSDKNKLGQPFLDKNGKPFWKVGILTEATGEQWYSSLAFRADDQVMNMKEGSAYTLLIWQDGSFFNFKIPTKTDLLEDRVAALEAKVFSASLGSTAGVQGAVSTGIDYPEDDIDPEDIPF